MSTAPAKLRCAIYTRKSSEEGLDQSFNSLDAQREACEAFIASQASLGWKLLPELYDDGGISGGTMDRPALQRLVADIRQKKIDVAVVYKIDRLTRSLMDFARIVEIFDQHGVSFVSITQQFNTTTSMGRLTLNVLLSFAQFEREVTAERIRDKVAASKKKGMWMGGNVPLGYQVVDRRLVIDEKEAEAVRWLFQRYLDRKSIIDLSREAQAANLYRRQTRKQSAVPFNRGSLHHLLSNPVYIGKVRHKGSVYDGQHAAIIDADLFHQVQTLLKQQAPKRQSPTNERERHLLGGLLLDERGQPYLQTYAQNHGRRYRYYVSRTDTVAPTSGVLGSAGSGRASRLSSTTIERIVEDQLLNLLADQRRLATWHEELGLSTRLTDVLTAADHLSKRYASLDDDTEKRRILRLVFSRITIHAAAITYEVDITQLLAHLAPSPDAPAQTGHEKRDASRLASISVPIQLKRRGVESRIVLSPSTSESPRQKDPMLIGLIANAHLYLEALTDGSGAGHTEVARRLGVHASDISRILPMAFLSPKITEAILQGAQPADLTIAKLTRTMDMPIDWKAQQNLLGL